MSAEVYATSYSVHCADCSAGYGPFDYEELAEASAAIHNDENHEAAS